MERYRLCDILPGERVVIEKIKSDTQLKKRLLDIGFIKETKAECVGISPFGDPKAFLVRGSVIALREEDSKNIFVKLPDEVI